MQWIKEFLFSCVIVFCFAATWIVAVQLGNFPWTLHQNPWGQCMLGGGIAVFGAILFKVSSGMVRLLGGAIATGALTGVIFPVYMAVESIFDGTSGFWNCLGVWLLYLIMIGGAGAGLVAAGKNAFSALLSFDFITVLICAALMISCFYCALSIIIASFDISTLLGIGVLVGLIGSPGGAGAETVSIGDAIVSDGKGGYQFEASRIGHDRIATTDGKTMREMSDGNYQEIN